MQVTDIRRIANFLLLAGAGIASAFATILGLLLLGMGWRTESHSVFFTLMWFLPVMSLPAFGLYFVFRRLGLVLSWLTFVGSFVATASLNIPDCKTSDCAISALLLKTLADTMKNRQLWVFIVAPLLLQCTMKGSKRSAPAPETR